MAREKDTRLRIAKPDIIGLFETLPKRVFDRSEIATILEENRDYWRLTASTGRNYFITYLIQNTPLTEHRFDFPNAPRLKYTWGNLSPLEGHNTRRKCILLTSDSYVRSQPDGTNTA